LLWRKLFDAHADYPLDPFWIFIRLTRQKLVPSVFLSRYFTSSRLESVGQHERLVLVLNMPAEASTTSISRAERPKGLKESQRCGRIAGNARKKLEQKTGRPVVTAEHRAPGKPGGGRALPQRQAVLGK